jgi:hypothetical protein
MRTFFKKLASVVPWGIEGGGGGLHARRLPGEKDATLAQKLGQLELLIALL